MISLLWKPQELTELLESGEKAPDKYENLSAGQLASVWKSNFFGIKGNERFYIRRMVYFWGKDSVSLPGTIVDKTTSQAIYF